MKLVLYPHVLEIGGSQLGALDLASVFQARGHEVVVFGQPGPLVERIGELGLEYVAAPRPRGRPSPPVMRALCGLVRRRGIDIVHGFEWTTAVEAYWGPRALLRVPAIVSVYSMAVAPFLPHDMPMIVGTEQMAVHERESGRPLVEALEPFVDLRRDAPEVVQTDEFVRRFALDPDALRIVTVTRLAVELKLEGLLVAIDEVAELARTVPAQLVIVGDGDARATVEERAERANARAGRRVVVLTGSLPDPRPAHAAADVFIGMGTSALRAMAFRSPVVVQGERGFWDLLTPETERQFLWTGFYGIGGGAEEGAPRLRAALARLADPALRERLGAYSRELVERRFSLDRAADMQLELYRRALESERSRRRPGPAAASAAGLVAYRARRRLDRVRGVSRLDDFNSNPVAAIAPPLPPSR